METCGFLLIAAVVIDAFLGDPAYFLHPVRLLGRSIEGLETAIRKTWLPPLLGGILLTVITLGLWEALLLFFLKNLPGLSLKLFLSLYVIYSSVALRDLPHHILPVLNALDMEDIIGARRRLQMIVGRDTDVLDKQGILRAAIETAAEGFVDGFLAPIFWYALSALIGGALFKAPCVFGVCGIWGYRTINTLDSMIGYRNERYLYFGRFAARLDDVVNFIPARLSILFLFLGAWFLGKDAGDGLDSVAKYRHHAASPNAGYPESFVAGAFHVRLGGPVQYPFGKVNKPVIGNGDVNPDSGTVHEVIRLITLSGFLSTGIIALFLILIPVLLGKSF